MGAIIAKITSTLSGDVAFIALLLVVAFLCAMYFGKNRIASIILSFYPTYVIYERLPYFNKLIFLKGESLIVVNKILLFILLLILITIGIKKYFSLFNDSTSMVRNVSISLAVVALILFFSYNVVNFDLIHNFSPHVDRLFVGETLNFIWLTAPLVILAII